MDLVKAMPKSNIFIKSLSGFNQLVNQIITKLNLLSTSLDNISESTSFEGKNLRFLLLS